ncbi:unspecific monooxygenase [Salvia divinorum]|uniref:Unspecific monooxygenase n=1 Tax=Salvia divinorum TaxID=28513 RepID=A0ABD1GCT1_SALDI
MQLLIVLSIAFLAAWLVYSMRRERSDGKAPPGPPRLPIIGNMLQLGRNPHKSLARLSKTYGPLMSLKLGNQLAAVVSPCVREGRAMNVGEATFTTMTNLMFATLFSFELVEYASADTASPRSEFREHVNAITRYIGVPNVADFFPILAPLDPQGIRRKLTYHLGSLLELVQGLIDERLQARTASSYRKKADFLETLLDISQGNEYDLSVREIKHMLVDLIIAGSDTSAATSEWAMVELLLHPDKMAKLKAELMSVLGGKKILEESDIYRLPYLEATIKELLRHHPVAPLLSPHVAEQETEVGGYIIPKDTKIFVNFWAISRDPNIWKNPESFEPERFLDSEIDFRGQHYELIPFSSGRRNCPGMPLASRMLPCMIATMCHNFDWELEKGAESKQLQREDVFGLALQKKIPLRAIPIKV